MFVLREFEKSKYILPKIFFCFIQLQLFIVHKTFFESRWADYKQDFLILRQFIQNLNENNYLPFKKYFGSSVPKLKGSEFNPDDLDYVSFYSG